MQSYKEIALKLLKKSEEDLTAAEQGVLERLLEQKSISRNPLKEFREKLTFGQRVADKVASFGGSWPFIGIFALFLILWIGINVAMLISFQKKPFDPYPFILLNLFLSMLAAIQAPVIMMSQNRHSAQDRLAAEHDYEVNLKAELEIMALHHKLDDLRERQLLEMIELQKKQIELLESFNQTLPVKPAE